jgi:hypothetical protein
VAKKCLWFGEIDDSGHSGSDRHAGIYYLITFRFVAQAITELRIYPIQRSRERDSFADVFQAADPGYAAFYAHAETAVGDAAVFS